MSKHAPHMERTLRRTVEELRALLRNLESSLSEEANPADAFCLERLCPDLFNDAPVAMFVASLEGALHHVNPVFARQAGFDSVEHCLHAVDNISRQLFPTPESFAILSSSLRKQGEAHLNTVQLQDAKGGTRWYNIHTRRLHADGNAKELALFTLEDTTERVRRDSIEREEHLRYKTIFENAAEALFQATPDGRLLMANKALARLFGCESINDFYESCKDVSCLLQDPTVYSTLMRELGAKGAVDQLECKAIRNHDAFWVAIRAGLVHDQQGAPLLVHGSMRDITDQKNLENRLLNEGFRDVLTGLVNRAMFLNLLDKFIARAKRRNDFNFALVAMKLDSFRNVKQSLGHNIAEEMLMEVSRKLVEQLRTEDVCARLGNDEFGLLLSDVERPADALRVLDRITAKTAEPLVIQGNELFPRLSSGIVLCDEDMGHPESMLDDADTALYRAKADPVQRFAVFNEAMQREATERLRTETDLRRALERNEFVLFYQPIVSLPHGKIAGFEALLRWQRPGVGLVPPDAFIPLMEETGLIVQAGEWALQQACRQARAWQRSFTQHAGLMISVNVSPRQLLLAKITEPVQRALHDSGLAAQSLKLEITENMFMAEPHKAMHALLELRNLGVGIAIDDFGAGYSSLSYLSKLPADTLKIDKAFIQDMRGDDSGKAIVKTIKLLADSLGKSVIAEGVETSQQLSQLLHLQCAQVQGYYFSKPLPAEDAQLLLSKGFEP